MEKTHKLRHESGFNQLKQLFCSFVLLGVFAVPAAFAQQTDEEKGIDQGNYNIKQSIEFGGRITNISGNQQTYNTLVNLQEGPRLLDFSTEMRSLDHRGTLFDRFYFSNFGYGGDPNVVSTLRISKNKWYAFDAMFRHDENLWDYSILANPFNPAPTQPNAPPGFNPIVNAPSTVLNTQVIAMSPHYFNTRRNMQNYGLLLLPDSKIRFRVGYNYNTNRGPAYDVIHEGTDQFLFQHLSATLTQYRFGVDFRFLPHTNISYDQTWSYYKTDPGTIDNNQQFTVGAGFPLVDLGASWNGPPCSPTFQPGGIVVSTCNAFYDYQSHWRSRNNAPTEQISLQSNPISSLQFSGKFSYTGSDFHIYDYQQAFDGRARNNLASYAEFGPTQGRHVASYGDFGATWQITHDLSLVDSFHYGNWNEPAQYVSNQCSFFSTSLIVPPTVFAPTATLPNSSCPTPSGAVSGTPTHASGSAPDILVNLDSNFLKQRIISNLIEGQLQMSPKAGAYFGYRYTDRVIADNFFNTQNAIYFPNNAARGNCSGGITSPGCTLNADGSYSYQTPNATFEPASKTTITANSAVLGLWLKPLNRLTINLDADFGSADNTFTPLSPRNYEQFRAKMQYRAATWANFSAYFTGTAGQNPLSNINGSEHNLNAGFSLSLTPSEKLSAQLGYNYNTIHSELLVCFTSSQAPQSTLPPCPGVAGLYQEFSPYTSDVNTGFLDVLWSPVRRLTVEVGANLSGVTGNELYFNTLSPIATAPAGPLNSNWYQPYGSVSYHFAKQWTGRARWDYYGYHEDSNGSYQDLYVPRNFHANLITLSVRFAF
ncbi:MAG TPA: hypothetical protein VGF61_01655 [Candidatus Acidoferrum sp.]